MPDENRPPLPASIDRASVDRILARALELQASTSSDPEGRLTEAQLVSLAKEVGLDPVNLRQALAEEKTRVSVPQPGGGVLASLYGGASAFAERTVRGTPSQVLKALDDWMQREESLVPQRYFPERIVWEPLRDFVSVLKRNVSGKRHALISASCVGATAIAVDETRVVVRLDAQLEGSRESSAWITGGIAMSTAAVGGVLAVLSFPPLAIVAPALVGVPLTWAASRSAHARTVGRAQLALEQVLDRLERGEAGRPPTLMSMLTAAVGGSRMR